VAAFELSYQRLDEISALVFRALPLNPGPDVSAAAAAVLRFLCCVDLAAVLLGLGDHGEYLAGAGPADRVYPSGDNDVRQCWQLFPGWGGRGRLGSAGGGLV
jgi:hypothetical protein